MGTTRTTRTTGTTGTTRTTGTTGVVPVAVVVVLFVSAAAIFAGQTPPPVVRTIPVGTMFNVLLQQTLDTAKVKQDQRFNTGTLEEWKVQGQVVVDLGTTVNGFVSSVRSSTQPVRKGEITGFGQMTLSFDEILIADRPVRLRASVVTVLDPRRPKDGEERRNATTNVVGGDGTFGMPTFADAAVSRSGVISAPGGGDVKIPVGMVLRIRLEQALEIPSK